jgi:adenine-specific DNA methylase
MVLSYNNEGIMDYDILKKMIEKKGALKIYKILYKKFKAQMSVDVENVYEYLWVLEVGKEGPTVECIIE